MCDLADGYNLVSRNDLRRAAKEHECMACGETIRKGDLYNNGASLYDGHWTSWKHCLRCDAMFHHIESESDEMLAIDVHLDCGKTWESAFGVSPPEHIAALAFWLPGEDLPKPPTE
jgi:hypothetical protein